MFVIGIHELTDEKNDISHYNEYTMQICIQLYLFRHLFVMFRNFCHVK